MKLTLVVVAMSGGVDSSVTLSVLRELPLNLSVLFMRNWDPLLSENADELPLSLSYGTPATHSPCSWERDWEDVKRVCKHVGIPQSDIRLVDLSKEYWTRVFEPAIAVWEAGQTPNPDVACNREIKFGALMQHIPPGHFLATGERSLDLADIRPLRPREEVTRRRDSAPRARRQQGSDLLPQPGA